MNFKFCLIALLEVHSVVKLICQYVLRSHAKLANDEFLPVHLKQNIEVRTDVNNLLLNLWKSWEPLAFLLFVQFVWVVRLHVEFHLKVKNLQHDRWNKKHSFQYFYGEWEIVYLVLTYFVVLLRYQEHGKVVLV